MILPYNPAQTRPELTDLLNVLKREIFLTLNCHALATVKSFDATKKTITAQINYSRTVTSSAGVQTPVNYSILADVPVISLCGGSTYMTFPIAAGDQALILFNDRDIDNWYTGARSGQVNSNRLHSMADGLALVGLNAVGVYDTVRAVLSDGDAVVGVGKVEGGNHLIRLANSLYTLNGLLSSLITEIKAITVNTVVAQGTSPAAPLTSGAPNNSAALTTIANNIGKLLE